MFVEDIAKLLTDAGVGVLGTNIFFSTRASIPTGTGPYISLIETGGLPPLRVQNRRTRPAYQRPAAQIITRATNYVIARDKALSVYNIVFAVRNRKVNNIWYQEMICLQEPFDAGTDDANRAKIIFNVRCIRRPTSS